MYIRYLEGHLCGEGELVTFKQTTCGVDKHRVSDAVNEVDNTNFNFVSSFGTFNSFLEHNAEGLE